MANQHTERIVKIIFAQKDFGPGSIFDGMWVDTSGEEWLGFGNYRPLIVHSPHHGARFIAEAYSRAFDKATVYSATILSCDPDHVARYEQNILQGIRTLKIRDVHRYKRIILIPWCWTSLI